MPCKVKLRFSLAFFVFVPFVWSSGGDITNASGKKVLGYFNSKGSQEGFQFIQDMVKKGYAPNSPKDKGFQTGKYAMSSNAKNKKVAGALINQLFGIKEGNVS